jgi:GTPase SAR1 family protein
MIESNSEAIDSGLRSRQRKITQAQDYLDRTQTLFEQFGSPELKASHAKFVELGRALASDRNVLLVVVGEFSRGKSSLVNALMGIELLRYAKEATTAVNTFIRALPAGRSDRFIRIHFMDKRPADDLAWTDSATLERWSTELDTSHADARRQVDHIEIFMSHPLLEQGLVLIDTPGLQSLVEHHEAITRKAIAEAHIAIWVQSAQQLGGNATEWAFLSETIRRNFSKFITVVNMWDDILESKDPQDAGKSEQQRAHDALAKVKGNFRKYLHDQPEDELAVMMDANHLIGVSAKWALDEDQAKRARSGVPLLAACIRDLFNSGEALEQVYRKPLKQMLHIQEQLAASIVDELEQLTSADTLAERQRDLELIDQEIRNLDLEMRNATAESQQEHRNAARHMAAQVEQKLVMPLANLKAEIEEQLTSAYVESRVAPKARRIGHPDNHARQFEAVSADVEHKWREQRERIGQNLEGLRATYADRMARHGAELNEVLVSVEINLAPPDVGFDLDLSRLESYHSEAAELEQAIAQHEDEVEALQVEIDSKRGDPHALEAAREALKRVHQRIDHLGPQPAPRQSTRSEKVSSGGLYSSAKYQDVLYNDSSNVDAWEAQMKREAAELGKKEAQLEAIKEEERRRTGQIISDEAAMRKYKKKLESFERQMKEAVRRRADAERDVVDDTLSRLRHATVGLLDQRIAYLKQHASEAIHQLYETQLELLAECVQEQYIEPLNAKRAQRESVRSLIEHGQAHVDLRRTLLGQGQMQVVELMAVTRQAGA